jgi:N-acyl-D-amino-acid deacylase
MRRYDPDGVLDSMGEVFRIGREANCPVHISHFNSRANIVLPYLDAARRQGVDATYDLYCYLAGSTILGMIALPPEVQEGGSDATLARLRDPEVRNRMRPWFENRPVPLETVRLSFIADPQYRFLEGLTLERAASKVGCGIGDLICDILVSSNLAVGCISPHRARDEEDVKALTRHPAMMAGSDGIYTGGHPHPRGCGCFARYLGHYVREAKVWSLEQAVQHLSAHAARRFGLKDRGMVRDGLAADLVIFDPETISDLATYDEGKKLATGVKHVLVNGQVVLRDGERTAVLPGRPLRHGRG